VRANSRLSRGRAILLVAAALLLVAAAGVGVIGWNARAAQDQIPKGVTIAGIDVGGMKAAQARALLTRRLVEPAARPVLVKLGDRTVELDARDAHVTIDVDRAIRDALAKGDEGNFLTRGWRELTGGKVDARERVNVHVDRKAVSAFVDRLATTVETPAVSAQLQISLDSVTVSDAQEGSRLDAPVRALKRPNGERTLTARTVAVAPEQTAEQVWAANPVVVTVSRTSTTVRVFDHGKVSKTYRVAVGTPYHPTPTGQFQVQSMQVDPPWNVPQSEWAGDLAGKTIPGGAPNNPLVARWIGFDGSVGFHGTASIDSLGSAASHGCVRMNPPDVIDLYGRVRIGTTVLVA
jgi:lipoprotein-anchoring transpeptidase ErfK/SrfK